MPEAFISITTSPGPGVGSGKLRSSTLRLPRKTAPRIGIFCLDWRFQRTSKIKATPRAQWR